MLARRGRSATASIAVKTAANSGSHAPRTTGRPSARAQCTQRHARRAASPTRRSALAASGALGKVVALGYVSADVSTELFVDVGQTRTPVQLAGRRS